MRKLVVTDNRGRITIPENIRNAIDLQSDDILCMTVTSDNSIVITKQRICDNCRVNNSLPLSDIVLRYPVEEREKALMQLSADWAKRKGGAGNA